MPRFWTPVQQFRRLLFMKKHRTLFVGTGALALLALGGLLAGCAHQEAASVAPVAPVTSAAPAPKSPDEIQAMAKQHGYSIPPNAASGKK